jgi:hypothetical protein
VKQTIVTDRAIYDIEKAKKWYEKQQENLGNKFADYVFKCFGEIQKNPLAYPSKYKYVREMYIRKYPYLIIYSVEEKESLFLEYSPVKPTQKRSIKNNPPTPLACSPHDPPLLRKSGIPPLVVSIKVRQALQHIFINCYCLVY